DDDWQVRGETSVSESQQTTRYVDSAPLHKFKECKGGFIFSFLSCILSFIHLASLQFVFFCCVLCFLLHACALDKHHAGGRYLPCRGRSRIVRATDGFNHALERRRIPSE